MSKPIERIVGKDISVQLVDIATRRGIDPSAQQVAVVTGTVADAVGVFRYTVLGGGHIAPEQAWVSEHIATAEVPILGSVTCNKLIFPQLIAALQEVQAGGWPTRSTPTSTPAATTRGSSPAARPSPTTPSAWPWTSTRSRTGEAPPG